MCNGSGARRAATDLNLLRQLPSVQRRGTPVIRCQTVSCCARTSGFSRGQALRQVGTDQPCQHIAAARRGQFGAACGIDGRPVIRRCDDSARAFEHHNRMCLIRQLLRSMESIVLNGLNIASEQTRGFQRVRGQHRATLASMPLHQLVHQVWVL